MTLIQRWSDEERFQAMLKRNEKNPDYIIEAITLELDEAKAKLEHLRKLLKRKKSMTHGGIR